MRLGIFAKTFSRYSLEATLDAVRSHGLNSVQFNMSCAGLPSMPDEISDEIANHIRGEAATRQITIEAVSGTFNMIHPNPEQRRQGLDRLGVLAAAARRLGTSTITLCTGTRNAVDMWSRHPHNNRPEAWRDLLASMEAAAKLGEENGVTMAFEPERNNVVDSAEKARRLLDEIRSPSLKVVMDGANLCPAAEMLRWGEILREAMALLSRDIVLAHAKDVTSMGETVAPGRGALNYDIYLGALRDAGFDGALILHGLSEAEVTGSIRFLERKLGTQTQ